MAICSSSLNTLHTEYFLFKLKELMMVQQDELLNRLQIDFHKDLLEAALMSLKEIHNPTRFNNFCSTFREVVRHVLHELAPISEIKKCQWYVPNEQSKDGLTRADRINYIVHGGISPEYVLDVLGLNIAHERKVLLKIINDLSKYTHVNPSTFNLPQEHSERIANDACQALLKLLCLSDDARDALVIAIGEFVDDAVVSEVMQETVSAVDEIATHHSIEEVGVEGLEVISVNATEVVFIAHGYLEAGLQWGSNSDVRNGNGAVMSENFPLTLKLTAPVNDIQALEAVVDTLSVDTSSWYDPYEDAQSEADYLASTMR